MIYECETGTGQRLTLENDGEQTLVHLSSHSSGQQQSQGTGFRTGVWSGEPTLYRNGGELIVRLETKSGVQGIYIRGHEIRHASGAPDLHGAERQTLTPAADESRSPKMEPMKPMEPMRPLEPLKPMSPMRPMEMRMSDMQMRMGGGGSHEAPSAQEKPASAEAPTGKRFCTQCGREANSRDRFCAACGHELA